MGSVTSILHHCLPESPSLVAWKERTKNWHDIMTFRGNVGTIVHNAISTYFSERYSIPIETPRVDFEVTTDMELEADLAMGSFSEFIRKFKLEPEEIEATVWHRKLRYAGRTDWIGWMNDRRVLLDWKTSSNIWPNHTYQVVAYKQAYLSDPAAKGGITSCFVVVLNPTKGLMVGRVHDEKVAWGEWVGAFNKFQEQFRMEEERIKDIPYIEV
jgi:hypothetical protein